jgi:flagellar motor switch protein FliM
MAMSGQNGELRNSLQRLLSRGRPAQTGTGQLQQAAVQALEAQLAVTLKKYVPLSQFTQIEAAGQGSADRGGEAAVSFVYGVDGSEDQARVELPATLIRAAFVGALGGTLSARSGADNQDLTACELRFAGMLANELAAMASPLKGKPALPRTISSREIEPQDKEHDLQRFQFSAVVQGNETWLRVCLPFTVPQDAATSADGPRMADATRRLVVAPEVKLRLPAMTMSEIAQLKRGDVISVNAGETDVRADVVIEGKTVLACDLGQIGNRYSARITGPAAAMAASRANVLERGGR